MNLFALYLLNKTIDTDLGPKIQGRFRFKPLLTSLMLFNSSVGCKYTHRTRKVISIAAMVLITIRKKVLPDIEEKLNQMMGFAILRVKLFYTFIYVGFTKILTSSTLFATV